MNKIFEILQEERNRILEMHENATKNQYLNEYDGYGAGPNNSYNNELLAAKGNVGGLPNIKVDQNQKKQSSYTTTKFVELTPFRSAKFAYVGLGAGTTFKPSKKNPDILTAQNAKVYTKYSYSAKYEGPSIHRISFYCKRQRVFFMDGGADMGYYSIGLDEILVKQVCGYGDQNNNQQQKPTQQTAQPIKSGFNKEKGTYTIGTTQKLIASIDPSTKHPDTIPAGTVVYHNYSGNDTKIVLGSTGVVAYCNRNTFIYKDSIDDLKNDGLMNVIKGVFCNGNKLKTWNQLTGSSTNTQQPGTDNQKQLNTQVVDLNKQIQQLLGNQQPTGQITDTDIDAILAKLG